MHHSKSRIREAVILLLLLTVNISVSCSDNNTLDTPDTNYKYRVYTGNLDNSTADAQEGIYDYLPELLTKFSITEDDYIRITTTTASNLPEPDRTVLKQLRESLPYPTNKVLLQKVISLDDVTTYMENIYGGTIGGFVSIAGDVKSLRTMYQVYWGLRLDYTGSEFSEDGAGYAVIRFYSDHIDNLAIPYSPEMGGEVTDPEPFGGGGFTTSTLGYGGFPEFKFDGYYPPIEGAELYVATPYGNLILRSVYTQGAWHTYEGEEITSSKAYGIKPESAEYQTSSPAYLLYKGEKLQVRGEHNGKVHLFTYDKDVAERLGMEQYEKGVYRIIADKRETTPVPDGQ